ncbi:uncharacterized protein LOC105685030 [Athalia rosae]|uniref:uncharacterized protein LOC105685030 n=1 Tax=Athalia rosae TaxID=37344 RepID=UPI002033E4C2|nr:uncharacterized protein LOC105685030 [Athalia rosae]
MKPQKKAVVVGRKGAAAVATTGKKRRASPEKINNSDPPKRDKKTEALEKKAKRVEAIFASAKKSDKSEDLKKKAQEKCDDLKKKLEKVDEKKKGDKVDDKKKTTEKAEERKRVEKDKLEEKRNNAEKIEDPKKSQQEELKKKTEKQEDKKKQNSKDQEKKHEKIDKSEVRVEEEKTEVKDNCIGQEKKKKDAQSEDAAKSVLQRVEDKAEENLENTDCVITKKKTKVDEKKKELKVTKKGERKKSPEKENSGKKCSPSTAKGKKEAKPKQSRKKPTPVKKTILAKKITSRAVPVTKKLLQTKMKLVKKLRTVDSNDLGETEEGAKKSKKKLPTATAPAVKNCKVNEKKPQLAKQMKSKVVPRKLPKANSVLSTKKEAKMLKLAEKIVAKKKNNSSMQSESTKNLVTEDSTLGKTTDDQLDSKTIKRELDSSEDYTPWKKSTADGKKTVKNNICKPKVTNKKLPKKCLKITKNRTGNSERNSNTSDEVMLEDLLKNSKIVAVEENEKPNILKQSKQETNGDTLLRIGLKVETDDRDDSSISATTDGEEDDDGDDGDDNEDHDDEENSGTVKSKKRNIKKRDRKSPSSDASSERARRMRLFGFWTGPKRHRVASLNASAKVHCLYENEASGVYLGGYCKPKAEKEKQSKKLKEDQDKEKEKEKDKEKDKDEVKEKEVSSSSKKVQETKPKVEEISPKRNLRNVPGLRGKHWDMMESSSSSPSSSDEEQRASEERKNVEANKKKVAKRRKKNEEVMDLKDMVVCKRMASLNASAILAASYSDEKYHCRGSSFSESSSESDVEVVRRRKQSDSEAERRKSRQGSDPEEVIKQPKKVVIVNQDTDVTITGVYVNQTRSTHHEGFCSIAGMQYRISSTSHTQTAATAVATEIHEHPKPEQPCKSYTPLGALSSMQPPGSQGPPHPPMSPRRHSAFSAPHQHGYYQPAGPLIQHPPTLPPVKAPPPEPTPTPPQNSEGSDDLVATSTTSGGTTSGGPGGGSFYRTYCPQYYGTPPQYQDLCYPPTYSHPHPHPHPHPPPYYKYAPTYRRQYYGYQESTGPGGGGPGGGGSGGGPGVVEYQSPPPPLAEYPPPPYYGGYQPPPPPPPPPGNPAYMHPQGRPFVDHAAFQGCPCPMQSCPKNVDTGPLIGNGKGAPVGSGPGLSLPPSALVGPPSPARGLAGLAPPHGANAWDTDRVQINNHRNLSLNQPRPPSQHNSNGGHNHKQNLDCRTKDEKSCQNNEMSKCNCQKHACTSTCEVKTETLSPDEKLSVVQCPSNKLPNLKLENNNVKCESCSDEVSENIPCESNCNVKCESGYKCEILKCEQCVKGQMAILDIDKDSGILLIDDKLEGDGVKEELNDVVLIDDENWNKPDYESTVQETVEEKELSEKPIIIKEQLKCQKITKRKLSLDSLSDNKKKRKINKRTLSVGSARDLANNDQSWKLSVPSDTVIQLIENVPQVNISKKKYTKKETVNKKRKSETVSQCEPEVKKSKTSKLLINTDISCANRIASESSIMETINSVVEQSLQITEKNERKYKLSEPTERKKVAQLLSTLKKVAKKINSVKTVPSKITVSKVTEIKNVPNKTQCEVTNVRSQESKPKLQDVKSKIKAKPKILNAKSKTEDAKLKPQEPKLMSEVSKQSEAVSKAKVSEVTNGILNHPDIRKPTLIKNRRKSTKKSVNKKACIKSEETLAAEENLALIRRPSLKPKWSNGWSWEGEPYEAKVYLTNEESAFRRCYASMRHISGDVLKPRDCVLLKSGPRKADLPFVAKIAALWENPHDGEMMFSLLWYYRPEHTEQGRTQYDTEDEVFASRHRDANSVACIEDKCYVLTFNEYCRYRKDLRRVEEGLDSPGLIVPPGDQLYPRVSRLPPIPVPADIVLFCRRVYDYRGKKLVKNPG